MKNLPEKIYLQIGEEADIDDNFDFNELVGVSWCSDKIEESDIEYIRKDFAEKQIDDTLCQLLNPLTKLLNDSEFREYVTEFINSRKALKSEK